MNLIDRQAVIEALTEYGNGRAVYIGVEEAVRRIEQLPSAQPQQIALTDDEKKEIYRGIIDTLQKKIDTLSSPQPEVIRCKDCKWKNQHNCTRAVEVWVDDDKFCAWAERKTDE